jgi:outer membrane protein assembly factor BamA
MPRPPLLLSLLLAALPATPQSATFPLESVAVEGSAIHHSVIAELAGLRLAAPIDKRIIESASGRLLQTGLFSSVSYRYDPGPNQGFALTFTLVDQLPLIPAAIDIPGVADDEVWPWLAGRFPSCQRRVPQSEAAHRFLAAAIERHLGARLKGQRLVARVEADLVAGKSSIVFQTETLPRIQSITFSGNSAIPTPQLDAALNHLIGNGGYSPRHFAVALESNLRPLYEEKGLYQASFLPTVQPAAGQAVSLTVAIREGAPYQLRREELIGEGLPVHQLLSAARFPTGKIADWSRIRTGIWAMENLIKAAGYLDAAATPERVFDHAARLLDLRIRIRSGPRYHFGHLRVTGLTPLLEKRALVLWQRKPGDPYDPTYAHVFFQSFFQSVDSRSFLKYNVEPHKRPSENIIDVHLIFESR